MSFSSKSLFGAVILAASAIAACSSSSGPALATDPLATDPADGGDVAGLSLFPSDTCTGCSGINLGFDETGPYAAAPVSAMGATGAATWVSADTSIATATGNATAGIITPVKAGATSVTVTDVGSSVQLTVTVASYKSADKAIGQQQYTKFKCGECHGGADEPDITPSSLAKHSDAKVLLAVTTGAKPETGEPLPYAGHHFAATAAIVTYLRSLVAKNAMPKND